MICITNNRSGIVHLSVRVEGETRPTSKAMLPGPNFIIDEKWEKAIQADLDFKGWCNNATLNTRGHALERGGDLDSLFKLKTFDEKSVEKSAGESPYRMVPEKVLVEYIGKLGNMKTLDHIKDTDPRPMVTNAVSKRVEVIMKPPQKTETQT